MLQAPQQPPNPQQNQPQQQNAQSQNEPQNLSTTQVSTSQPMMVIPPHHATQWHIHTQPPIHMMYQQGNPPQPQNGPQQPQLAPMAEQLAQLQPLPHSIWNSAEIDNHGGMQGSYPNMNDMHGHNESDTTLNTNDLKEDEQETKPKIKKEVKKKRKLADLLAEGIDPTKLEENSDQVRERFEKGCECEGDNCFKNMNPEFVFRHRLNIAELTKNEHDMYLMGVTMACLANPEETSRHKERKRLRASYVFQGKKVCLDAFLYLENCTHYQLKAIRKHVMVNGVTPRVHGNHGKKPPNTFPLDTYEHAVAFLQSYITRYSPNANIPKKPNKSGKTPPIYLPADITRKKIHSAYREYCEHFEPHVKVMGYSSFRQFMKGQLPYVKFFRVDHKNNRHDGNSDDDDSEGTGAQPPQIDRPEPPQPQQQQQRVEVATQVMPPPQPPPQQVATEPPKDPRNTPPVTSTAPIPPPQVQPNTHPGVVSMPHCPITNYSAYSHVQLPLNLQTQQPLYSACMQPGMFPPGQAPAQIRPTGFPYTNL